MGPCGQTRWLWTTLHVRSPVAHHMHCTDQKAEAVDSGREETPPTHQNRDDVGHPALTTEAG